MIEGRIPWVLLNVADPSSKQRIATDWSEGLSTVSFNRLTLSAGTYIPDSGRQGEAVAIDGPTNVADSLPAVDGSSIRSAEYTWQPWNRPSYEERLKESYHILRERTLSAEFPDTG